MLPDSSTIRPPDQSRVIEALLGAQAAIAAIAIAVIVFVLEGRRDVTNFGVNLRHRIRVLVKYEERTDANSVVATILISVATSSVALVLIQPARQEPLVYLRGIGNLPYVVIFSFGYVLLQTWLFYSRSVRYSRPDMIESLRGEAESEVAAAAALQYSARTRQVRNLEDAGQWAEAVRIRSRWDTSEHDARSLIREHGELAVRSARSDNLVEFERQLHEIRRLVEIGVDAVGNSQSIFSGPHGPIEASFFVSARQAMNRVASSLSADVGLEYRVSVIEMWGDLLTFGARSRNGELACLARDGLTDVVRATTKVDTLPDVLDVVWLTARTAIADRISTAPLHGNRNGETQSDFSGPLHPAVRYDRELVLALVSALQTQMMIVDDQTPTALLQLWNAHNRVPLSLSSGASRTGERNPHLESLTAEYLRLARIALLAETGRMLLLHGPRDDRLTYCLTMLRAYYVSSETLVSDVIWALEERAGQMLGWSLWESSNRHEGAIAVSDPNRYALIPFFARVLELGGELGDLPDVRGNGPYLREWINQNFEKYREHISLEQSNARGRLEQMLSSMP